MDCAYMAKAGNAQDSQSVGQNAASLHRERDGDDLGRVGPVGDGLGDAVDKDEGFARSCPGFDEEAWGGTGDAGGLFLGGRFHGVGCLAR